MIQVSWTLKKCLIFREISKLPFLFGYLNGKFIELLFEFHGYGYLKIVFVDGEGEFSQVTKILTCLSKRTYLKRQRVCLLLKFPEFSDIGLYYRQKNTHNSVFLCYMWYIILNKKLMHNAYF